MNLTISGDFCITPSYISKNLLSSQIINLFKQSDFNIVNLECPVFNGGDENKIVKHGPHLKTSDEIFKHLKQLNIGVVTLANNHIFDYGNQGLQSTLARCKENDIVTVGVGHNLKDAALPVILEIDDVRVALVNFCENEWSIATDDTPGANPLDITENYAQIKNAKAIADFVLVIIHGGNEYYNLPSPRMVKQYRFFAESGADAVIGHHTHCISGFEVHNNVPIFYSLGNFLFTMASDHTDWYTGLTLQLNLQKDQPLKWNLIPIAQSKNNFELTVLEGENKQNVLNEIAAYSSIIADSSKLKSAWTNFIEKKSAQYLFVFSAINIIPGRYIRAILKRLGFMKILFPQKYLESIINYLYCEAHLDISQAVLRNRLLKK